jgi:protein phosphatase
MVEFFGFTNIGARKKNEDYILNGNQEDRSFFIVCDGVGGGICGEIASRLVCHAFADFFQQKSSLVIDEKYFRKAIEHIEAVFDKYLVDNPDTIGMATTLALLLLDKTYAYAVHVGDSRIYHLSNGKIQFQTRDHSVINQLLDNNIITPEEAKTSNQKHVLTRAIQGKRIKAAIIGFAQLNVNVGDYFFLCTDGVIESVSEQQLTDILSGEEINQRKVKMIEEECSKNSHDNYSGYLIQIKST